MKDEIAVLETNIDDATGEILGYTIDKLLAEGAKDVSIIPMVTKKNRPGQIIKVIADQKDVPHLSRVLIDETGTLGVRVYYLRTTHHSPRIAFNRFAHWRNKRNNQELRFQKIATEKSSV